LVPWWPRADRDAPAALLRVWNKVVLTAAVPAAAAPRARKDRRSSVDMELPLARGVVVAGDARGGRHHLHCRQANPC
jgi:hypothetical protein